MQGWPVDAVIWVVVLVIVSILFVRLRRRRRRGIGAAAAGTIYDWLNEDNQHAVEIIVEERAAARDPEDRDGSLPDLENPNRP